MKYLAKYSFLILLLSFLNWSTCEDLLEDEMSTESKSEGDAEEISTKDIPVTEGFGGPLKFQEEDGVIILNEDNYDLFVTSRPTTLVNFFTPWCRHCQELEPEYIKAAKMLKKSMPPVPLAKVDVNLNEALARKVEMKGFPTLYYYINGVKLEYEGPRSAAGIVEYMQLRSNPYWRPPPETMFDLSSDNFHDYVDDEEIMMVMFYTPECKECDKMKTDYDRAARRLKSETPSIILARVNGKEEEGLVKKFEVESYPTLIVFRKGKPYKFHGPRIENELVTFMHEQAKPISEMLPSAAKLKKFASEEEPTIIGFFSSKQSTLFDKFVDAGNRIRGENYKFLHSFSKDLRADLKTELNTLVLMQPAIFQSENEPKFKTMTFEKDVTAQDMVHFIGNNSIPLVGQRKGSNMWKFADRYPIVVVYYDVDFSFEMRGETQLVRKEVLKVAEKYKDKNLYFAISDETEFEFELKHLGLDESGNDVNAGLLTSERVRYALDPKDDFTIDRLSTFIDDVLSGKMKPILRSQQISSRIFNPGDVYSVVGQNFNELILNNEKEVLIEFYAPWCLHCKRIESTYEELAGLFKSIYVAKFDAIANDYPPPFKISGYPSIYFISPEDRMNPIKFTGPDRTLRSMAAFLRKHSKTMSLDERQQFIREEPTTTTPAPRVGQDPRQMSFNEEQEKDEEEDVDDDDEKEDDEDEESEDVDRNKDEL